MNKISLFSREQEKKKVFIQLGRKFNLPLDIIIYLFNTLHKNIAYDRSLQINFHKNILSSHLCEPSSFLDIDNSFLNPINPYQYRLPINKGNEWLIHSYKCTRNYIIYNDLYNELKPIDIINKQIEIYGDTYFLLKSDTNGPFVSFQPLKDIERMKFIDAMGTKLFDLYFEYLENTGFNVLKIKSTSPVTWQEIWLDEHPYN